MDVNAQLCTGSLGDPVVNISFGSGPNPGAPISASTTNYSYVGNDCPNDGSYTIINSSLGCFGNSWHNVPQDHTPNDVNGYMMLVNASFNPGVFFLDTVKNLCGSTTYEFSAWMLNILKHSACGGSGIKPNISFSIETTTGTVIQTYNTGDIPNLDAPQWNQYGFFFTLPPAVTDLVLRMTNNAPGGCGNDLALDDISFRPCGPKIDAGFVNIIATSDTVNFCITDNKSIQLGGAIQTGFNNPAYQWQLSTDNGNNWADIAGATNGNLTQIFSTAGVFQYRLSSAEAGNIGLARCRVASKPLTVIIDPIPVIGAANTSPVCVGDIIKFSASGGSIYNWTGPNGFTANTDTVRISDAQLSNAGIYNIVVQTKGGCSKQDATTVVVNPNPVPDAGTFTQICAGTSTVLQATGGNKYSWIPILGLSNPAISNPIANPLFTTTYTVIVSNQFNCKASDTVSVIVLKNPLAFAGPDKKIQEGQQVQLDGSTGGDVVSYFWSPVQFMNNPALLTPIVSPTADITYTLHVQSGNGCGTAADDVFVRVFRKINIPNAFSPNGDGINDVWNIDALASYPESTVKVFNRYGQIIFQSNGYLKPWDGTFNGSPLPFGTYYYIIDRKNGFPLSTGWVAIIR